MTRKWMAPGKKECKRATVEEGNTVWRDDGKSAAAREHVMMNNSNMKAKLQCSDISTLSYNENAVSNGNARP